MTSRAARIYPLSVANWIVSPLLDKELVMRGRMLLGLAVAAVAVFATAYAAEEIKVEGIKCVVAGT